MGKVNEVLEKESIDEYANAVDKDKNALAFPSPSQCHCVRPAWARTYGVKVPYT